MDSRRDIDDDKLIEALKKVLQKVPEADKAAVEIKIAELEENKKHAHEYTHDFTTPKHVIRERIEGLNDEYDELTKQIEAGHLDAKEGELQKQMTRNKQFFLETAEYNAPEATDAPEFPPVTGLLQMEITDIHVDPLMYITHIAFLVNGKLQHDIKPDFRGKINFGCRGARLFELVVHAEEATIAAYAFCPAWKFVAYRGDFAVSFALAGARITAIIDFLQGVALARARAEVLRVERVGHVLCAEGGLAPERCGVCAGTVSVLKPGFRCASCSFLAHRGCTDFVLFPCPLAKAVRGAFRRGYTVPHTLETGTSLGASWCAHCGKRLSVGTKTRHCQVCGISVHAPCAVYLFNGCGITFEQRRAICSFKPPAPASAMPLNRVACDSFDFYKVLGSGANGKVFLARHRADRCVVALKAMRKQQLLESGELPFVDAERTIMRWAADNPHPFTVGLRYCFYDASRLFLGMEAMPGGDLLTTRPKTHKGIQLVAAEVTLALGHLHDYGIIFRDVKMENIMVAADGHIKLADYGLCKQLDSPLDRTYTYCGTPCTTAPEVLTEDGYTKDCDWWGLGCVLYELYEGEPLFSGATTKEVAKQTLTKIISFTNKTDPEAKVFILDLLERDPARRLGTGRGDYRDVQKHSYFKHMNWDWVYKKKYTPEIIPGNIDVSEITERVQLSPCPERRDLDVYFNRFPNA